MEYLFFGNQLTPLLKKMHKFILERLTTIDDFNYFTFSLPEASLDDAISKAEESNLFGNQKVVVVKNCTFLESGRSKEKKSINEQTLARLKKYFAHPNSSTDFIFVFGSNKIDTSHFVYTHIKVNGKIFEQADLAPNELVDYIHRYFTSTSHLAITNDAAILLAKYIEGDLERLYTSAAKLASYTTEEITIDDVKACVNAPLDEDVFQISNALLNNDTKTALLVYNQLKVTSLEPIALIAILASNFLLLSQIRHLLNLRYNFATIATTLKINEYRAKVMVEKAKSVTLMEIESILTKLYNLDYNIKSGQVDRFIAFELFLATFKV
jgi:DNA polymerase-3 subunit delta